MFKCSVGAGPGASAGNSAGAEAELSRQAIGD